SRRPGLELSSARRAAEPLGRPIPAAQKNLFLRPPKAGYIPMSCLKRRDRSVVSPRPRPARKRAQLQAKRRRENKQPCNPPCFRRFSVDLPSAAVITPTKVYNKDVLASSALFSLKPFHAGTRIRSLLA